MSVIANQGIYWFTILILPLQLGKATDIEFVTNTFAILYICTLDDLHEPKIFEIQRFGNDEHVVQNFGTGGSE